MICIRSRPIPAGRRRCWFRGRRNFHVRVRCSRLSFTNAGHSRRAPAIRLYRLHLLCSGSWRRRGRGFGHDRARNHVGGRAGSSRPSSASKAVLLWSNVCHRGDRCRGDFTRIHTDHIPTHGLSGGERRLRCSGHGVVLALILIGDVCHLRCFVYVNVVVDVGDLGAVYDHGVRNVHAFHVTRADVIGRAIDVTRAERKPRHTGSAANRYANSKVRATNPGDKGRSINGTYIRHGYDRRTRGRGYPAPRTAYGNPSAVVERGEAPRRIIHPSPAPWRNPDPVAVTIRCPTGNRGARKPNCAVLRHGVPTAIFVQIFIANNIVGNILWRRRTIPAPVAVTAPTVKIVIAFVVLHIGAELICTAEGHGISGVYWICRASAGNFTLAVANRDDSCVAIFVYVNAIRTGTQNVERQIGRVDL